jgi:hypothetical protein
MLATPSVTLVSEQVTPLATSNHAALLGFSQL